MTNQQKTEHELPSSISEENPFQLQQLATRSSQSLPSIIENNTETTSISFNDIQKEFDRISHLKNDPTSIDLSSLTNSDALSSIPYIDSSSLDDQEISERKHSNINRKISLSETDLLASLHRNLNKHIVDHDTTDDILFLEWDKERNLFQDYINSLRKEIRVLLQERLEYQTENKHINDEQMKIDLLQKSLEEKNFVLEQLQTEYEVTKDKNINSIRKISLLQCDAKSYVGIIDELKQKIADLTVDLQNHIIIKRRLEISIKNLETDCKIIDAERMRLTNDIKENQHKKQDSEKLLQKANVQIAEQGSTIEMLRSENVQVRSQLSAIQRRMFQEKQQIMDYLRQIENDLIEKEQIKQRESLLRQDYEQLQFANKQDRKEIEQLKNSINKDQQKINELQDECSQLLKTIQTQNEEKIQLESQFDTYKSEILEDQYHIVQSPVQSTLELTNEHNQLRQELESLTAQCKQLNEANQAWQQYQQNQLMILHDRFKLSNSENLSFDDLVQQIENRLSNLQNECDTLANRVIELQATPTNNDIKRSENELQQNLAVLTSQCAQLNEANRAWQQFHQTQLDNFRNKLQNSLPIDNTFSFDEIAQLISDHIHQLVNQRDTLIQNLNTTEKLYSDRQNGSTNGIDAKRQGHINAIDEQLNKRSTDFLPELSTFYPTKRADLTPSEDVSIHHLTSVQSAPSPIIEHNEELWENLANVTTQFDATNRAWQQDEVTRPNDQEETVREDVSTDPIDILRNHLEDCLSLDYNVSFDQIVEQLVDKIKRERKESNERYELLERANRDLRSESDNNMETIRQSYLNAVNELNQELLATKEQYEQLDAEKQLLNNQLENRSDQQHDSQIIESSSSDFNLENVNQQLLLEKQTFNENSIDDNQLRQDYILLQNQCTQLDIANRAWQLFYDNQMDLLTNKFKDYFDFDNNDNFDQIIEMIATEFHQQNQLKDKSPSDSAALIDSLQKQLENFQYNESILAQNLEQLNQKLHDVYKQCEEFREHNAQLILSKQQVDKQLEEREKEIKLLINNSNQYTDSPIDVIPVDNVNQEQEKELHQLRIDLAALTTQCAQLDEANRAWQQSQPAQLHHLQNKLQDYLPLHDNISFEELSQMILDQIIKEREDFNQRYQALQKTNDDLRLESVTSLETINELNQQLLIIKESDEIPFGLTRPNDQEEIVREDVATDPIDILRNHLEDCLSLDYNVSFDQIVEQLVDKIKRERKEFNEHYELLERENRDRRLESDANTESIRESCLDTIKELNQELLDTKEQCNEFDRMNKQLIIENEIFTNQLSDRSIAVRHHSTSPTEELHLRSTITSNHNKVNSINTIDKEIQTESIFPDEKSLNIDEDNEYINEISSLSSIDVSNQLNKECQQILSKQNFELTSFPNLDLNQLSLIALHSLYNQHLTDEAKQLYNETVIRALKQEYELINNEKNDLIESQLRMNSLHLNEKLLNDQFEQLGKEYNQLKRDFNEITNENELLKDYNAQMYHEKLQENDSIEIKLSHDVDIQCDLTQSSNTEQSNWNNDWTDQNLIKQTVDNETQTDGQQPDKLVQVNNKLKRALQTIKDKINRIVIEQPELFPTSTDDTIVRLDSLISAIEQQAAQIDVFKTKAIISTPMLRFERNEQLQELKEKYSEIRSNIDDDGNHIEERDRSKSSQTMDNETQTDDQQPDRLVQINNKLKRALQNIKEKVHRIVVERPELFPNSTDDTIERLDYLISAIENQAAQIESLQTEFQHKDQETNLLRERLNEVELQLKKTLDDHALTMNKYQSLVEERTALVQQQSLQSEEYEQLREEVAQQKRIWIIEQDEEIKSLKQIIEQQTEELRDLMGKNLFQEQRFNERENQIDNLMQERARLLEEIEKHALPVVHTTDNDTQTDDHQHEKLVQLNNKLKRVLQGFKDKIHRVVAERPDLFDGVSTETSERLDHLISTVENQATQIHALQAERDQLRNEMKQLQCSFETSQKELDNERQIKMEQLSSLSETISSSTLEDYQKQIDQLTQNLSQKDEEQSLLRDRLNEVEVELRTFSDRETAQLKEEIAESKEVPDYQHVEVQTDEDVKALHEMIEHLKDLNEKNTTFSSQFDNLMQERARLLEEIETNTPSPVVKTDSDTQTDDPQYEKLVQLNNKLKRLLQVFKDKVHRIVVERPDLFNNIGEETSERLDHLISTVENQATQIDSLQSERDQTNEKYQHQIKELQSSLIACQYELDNERQMKVDQLVSSAPSDINSSTTVEDYQKEIDQLRQVLSHKDQEQSLLQERLNKVELEFTKTLDDHVSTVTKSQSLKQERDELIEQQTLQSAESQRAIEQLKLELIELKQSPITQHVEIQTDEDTKLLHEVIQQQSDQLNIALSSEVELDRHKKEKKTSDNETQTDDDQHEELLQTNDESKRALQAFVDKIYHIVAERPDLFDNIGEETNERLDHLISTVENQSTQINILDAECEQQRKEIKELQSSLESYQKDKIEQLDFATPLSSSPDDISSLIIEKYQNQIELLQQNMAEKDEERTLLGERLNGLELELQTTIDNHELIVNKCEEDIQYFTQERNALIEQQALRFSECEREIEQLKTVNDQIRKELADLKQSPDYQHIEIQTDEDIKTMDALIAHQTTELRTLKENCLSLSFQIDSNAVLQVEANRQRNEMEEQMNVYKNQIETLMQEIEKNTLVPAQTIEHGSQTDDQQHEKLNNELKNVLQGLTDKIHQIVAEKPELFHGMGEEANDCFDRLISTVENQTTQIHGLQAERDQLRNEMKQLQCSFETCQKELDNERQIKMEQLSSPSETISSSTLEDYQKQIDQLTQNLSQKDEEQILLRDHLNEVEVELRKTLDEQASTINQYQSLHSEQSGREIAQLKEEIAALKQIPDYQHVEVQTDEDVKALHEMIEHLKNLNEKNINFSSQFESQVNNLMQERARLLEEIETYKSSPVVKTDSDTQTDDPQHEKLVDSNHELKHTLQAFKDKVHRIVAERPDLFDNIGEETSERLDHLISTVENQATQIHVLQTEMKEFRSSLVACQYELDTERQMKMDQLVSSAPSDTNSSTTVEDYQKEIDQLRQVLSHKDQEQSLLQERLNKVELEFTKTLDDHVSTMTKSESLKQERDELIEQRILQSAESQRAIEQLKLELIELKQSPITQHVEIQTDEDTKLLHEVIQQQSDQLKDLNEKNTTFSSQFDNLMQERARLLEEIETYKSSPVVTTDSDTQTDDPQYEKLVDSNNELQAFKDKVHRIVVERPDLFNNIGEETNERLDHLISTVENQATQIEMKELRSSLEACQYELDNERRMKMEQLVSASTSEDISSSAIEEYQKQIDQLQQNLSGIDAERTFLRERLNDVELELEKTLDDHTSIMRKNESLEQEILRSTESQHEIAQLKEELTKLKQSPEYHHVEIQTDEDMKVLHEMIEQLKDLNEKNLTLESQVELTTNQKTEIEQRLNEHENLLKELEKNTSLSNQTTNTDDEHEELLAINKKLKSEIETIETKIHHIFTARADLFGDIGKETNERLDSLISAVQNQATERNQLNEKYQRELNDLQNSFDMYRQQLDNEYHIKLNEHISSLTHEIDSPINQNSNRIENEIASDLNESNDWFDASPEITINDMMEYDRCQDIDIQCELRNIPLALNHNSTQTDFDSFSFEDLQNKIKELQSSFDIYGNEIANEHLIKMEPLNDVNTQTLGLSMSEEYQKQIEQLQENERFYQREIERLIEERDQAQDLVSQWKEENKKRNDHELFYELKVREQDNSSSRSLNNSESQTILDADSSLSDSRISDYQSQIDDLLRERLTLMEQIKQLTSQPSKPDIESQPINNINLLSSSNQSISRHIFEQEMLAWSKESEELKRLVKQIQIENKKLKDIIHKFERMVLDYVHENERLKQENQNLSLNNYSTLHKIHETETFTNSDKDICYLTLKWLTYEVAQRTSNNNQQSILLINDSEQDLKQRYNDTERQIKNICLQNERLKNQLETYTIQFNHLQHEMSIKIQEISTLKDETERLRVSEIQCRLEADHLKSELQDDQLKIQQLERDLLDIKFKQSSKDANSIDNLRELLELKERELNALKDKLDYTKQAHQTELQEAIKANQFSLENVKRYEQMESRYKEKQRELETRIGKFCKITRPLINNQELFIQNPIINIDELRKLIAEADTEEKITNSLSPIRDCLSMLEAQMKDLHHSIIENHARRSKRWKYKLGFECLSCESRWEVTHDVRDLQMACLDPSRFLESSIVEPMAGCSCPIIDFMESDVRMCVDDILNEVITRTTVK